MHHQDYIYQQLDGAAEESHVNDRRAWHLKPSVNIP
jgi:hypothetical protein